MAMTARTLSCVFGSGVPRWLSERFDVPLPLELPPLSSGDEKGGRPREVGGAVGKVW